jgi:hypothetical protein
MSLRFLAVFARIKTNYLILHFILNTYNFIIDKTQYRLEQDLLNEA